MKIVRLIGGQTTGKEKQSKNYFTLKKALESKFLRIIDKNGKIENKAIFQLISNIRRVFDKFYSNLDNDYNAKTVKIYPYLVTHDRQFDTPELNRLLNIWFVEEKKKSFTKDEQDRICNLTILNIDSILLNREDLKKRGINGLETLTRRFHNSIRLPSCSTTEIDQSYLETSLSFYMYLARHFDRIKRSTPSFIDKYLALLNID